MGLSSFLDSLSIGDKKFNARIECYSCKRVKTDKKLAKMIESQYSGISSTTSAPSLSNSISGISVESATSEGEYSASLETPLGSLALKPTRGLLVDLISNLNLLFSDYDFTNASADEFISEPSYMLVINKINSRFSEIFESNPTLVEELWKNIDIEICLKDCNVYTFIPDPDASPFPEHSLWSFLYFFHNKGLKKMVTFMCYTTSNLTMDASYLPMEEDEEEGNSLVMGRGCIF